MVGRTWWQESRLERLVDPARTTVGERATTMDLLSRHCQPLQDGAGSPSGDAPGPDRTVPARHRIVVDDPHLAGRFDSDDFPGGGLGRNDLVLSARLDRAA